MKNKLIVLLFSVLAISFNSCIGLSIDIQMNRNGSGSVTFEYRINRSLENIGLLDGNERWPAIPVGRADWERTVQRIPGAGISSFSSRNIDRDTVTTVTLNFDSPQTLLAILDPEGERTSIIMDGHSNQFVYLLFDAEETKKYDESLFELMREAFADYNFAISFSAPGNVTMTTTNAAGDASPPPASTEVIPSGRRASLKIGIMDLLGLPDGLGVNFRW